jgi:hemerythrin
MEAKPLWWLDWNEDLSMYIPKIDAEHQGFIQLVNELNQAIIVRMNNKKIKSRMRAILDDAAMHFAHEEAVCKEWRYPDAEEHARKHAQIISFLNEIMQGIDLARMEHGWLEVGKISHALNNYATYFDHPAGAA